MGTIHGQKLHPFNSLTEFLANLIIFQELRTGEKGAPIERGTIGRVSPSVFLELPKKLHCPFGTNNHVVTVGEHRTPPELLVLHT